MISGLTPVLGMQPVPSRARGLFFRNGAYFGVPWRAIQTTGSAAQTADTLVLNIHPLGNMVVGPAPNGQVATVSNSPLAGKNARGTSAIDLQLVKTSSDAATQVASGTGSALLGGASNTASQTYSAVVGGNGNTASSASAFVGGGQANTASGNGAAAFGYNSTASGNFSMAICGGTASRVGQFSMGGFSALGASFAVRSNFVNLAGLTSDATPLTLLITNQSSFATSRLTVTSGTAFYFDATIVGVRSDGSAVSAYRRTGIIKNVGGTTTLLNSVTIGVDYEDNVLTDITLTADDTNDALQINVTGIAAQTYRWMADVWFSEIPYGT